jgi:hypothetical protein
MIPPKANEFKVDTSTAPPQKISEPQVVINKKKRRPSRVVFYHTRAKKSNEDQILATIGKNSAEEFVAPFLGMTRLANQYSSRAGWLSQLHKNSTMYQSFWEFVANGDANDSEDS